MGRAVLWFIGRLFRYTPGHTLLILLIEAASASLSGLSLVFLGRLVNDGVLFYRTGHSLVGDALLYFGAALFFPQLLSTLSTAVQERQLRLLQHEITTSVLTRAVATPLVVVETAEYQDFLKAATNVDGQLLQRTLTALMGLVSGVARTASVLVVLFLFNHWMPLLIVMATGVTIFGQLRSQRRASAGFAKIQASLGRRADYFMNLMTERETLTELWAFRSADWVTSAWRTQSDHYVRSIIRFFDAVMGSLTASQIPARVLSLAMQGIPYYESARGELPIGEAIAFSSAIMGFTRAVLSVASNMSQLWQNAAQITFLRDFVTGPDADAEPSQEGEAAASFALGDIEFRNVWFSYRADDTYALRNISFRIRQGERVALVGQNGSGKSTLVRLLLGLNTPSEGQVLVNGAALSGERGEAQAIAYRAAATVAFQDYCRYHLHVRDNVELAAASRAGDDGALQEALANGGGASFVTQLPNGVDQQLGTEFGGVDLSGGQWQALAIARTYYRNTAELLVMDEPTSALDPVRERRMYEQFLELSEGRTAVIVSHRLGAAMLCDRIFFFAEGELREVGNHAQLMAVGGGYASMFRLQASWYAGL